MTKIEFHTGQAVDVVFDEKEHSYHIAHYLADGGLSDYKPTHGITAPLETVPKPYLKQWAAKLAAEATIDELSLLNWDGEDFAQFLADKKAMETNERYTDEKGKDKPVMSEYSFKKRYPWFSKAKGAFKTASDGGKEAGTWIHQAIENFYKSDRKDYPTPTVDTEPIWESFTQFDNFFKPQAEELEFLVYSLQFGYSGTGDFKGVMNGKTCIGDWKSTNRNYSNPDGISVEYFYQLGGLAQAEFERTGKWVDDLFIANFDKKGEEPRVKWASEFGMSPADCAKAYISHFNTYHVQKWWEYKYKIG